MIIHANISIAVRDIKISKSDLEKDNEFILASRDAERKVPQAFPDYWFTMIRKVTSIAVVDLY
jgi:hypothetical protein